MKKLRVQKRRAEIAEAQIYESKDFFKKNNVHPHAVPAKTMRKSTTRCNGQDEKNPGVAIKGVIQNTVAVIILAR